MKSGNKVLVTVLLLFGLLMVALVSAVIVSVGGDVSVGANVAIIPIEGTILSSGASFNDVASSETIIKDIKKAEDTPSIKAVMFVINSPGGSAVASDEIARAIRDMEKPTVAVVKEVGASGAYWVASATDHVVANRMSVTGSIGVISSYLSFGEFLEDWNVTYNQLIAGDRKDVGTPFRELDESEREYLQEKLDAIHEFFIEDVAKYRNKSVEDIRGLADGSIYLGSEAYNHGLIDELGGETEAKHWINSTLGIEPVTVEYKHEPTLVDVLAGLQAPTLSVEGVNVPLAR